MSVFVFMYSTPDFVCMRTDSMYPQRSQLLLFTAKAVFVNLEEGIRLAQVASGSTLGRVDFRLSGQTRCPADVWSLMSGVEIVWESDVG